MASGSKTHEVAKFYYNKTHKNLLSDMALQGFTPVPFAATLGGAPIDAFQMDAFRRNDLLFEQLLRGLMCSPFFPAGHQGASPYMPTDAREFVNARVIELNSAMTLTPSVPLIWFASERIVLNASINGDGAGAQPADATTGETGHGDFGGSGGGSKTAVRGGDCRLPFSGALGIDGGPIGVVGNPLTEEWASRALAALAFCKGGAAGGNESAAAKGGAGGGVVFLCAPEIHLGAGVQITVRGTQGAADCGGGGGGLIVLLSRRVSRTPTVAVTGGAANGDGKAGGDGRLLQPAVF